MLEKTRAAKSLRSGLSNPEKLFHGINNCKKTRNGNLVFFNSAPTHPPQTRLSPPPNPSLSPLLGLIFTPPSPPHPNPSLLHFLLRRALYLPHPLLGRKYVLSWFLWFVLQCNLQLLVDPELIWECFGATPAICCKRPLSRTQSFEPNIVWSVPEVVVIKISRHHFVCGKWRAEHEDTKHSCASFLRPHTCIVGRALFFMFFIVLLFAEMCGGMLMSVFELPYLFWCVGIWDKNIMVMSAIQKIFVGKPASSPFAPHKLFFTFWVSWGSIIKFSAIWKRFQDFIFRVDWAHNGKFSFCFGGWRCGGELVS